MVNVYAVLMIVAYFSSGPVLAFQIPLALLVPVPYFFSCPVSSTLPMDNGVPRAINMINGMIQEGKEYRRISSAIGWAVERWGYTELKQYCQLDGPHGTFGAQCAKLNELYALYYTDDSMNFDYHWDQRHFADQSTVASLDGYLTIIGDNMDGGNAPVSNNLHKSWLEDGLKEMKEYCNERGKRENKRVCKVVQSIQIIHVPNRRHSFQIREDGAAETEATPSNELGSSSRSRSKGNLFLCCFTRNNQ